MDQNYSHIVKHYEECFEEHGDTNKGVDWPNIEDALTRYRVMEDSLKSSNSVLDFGCGLAHFHDYLLEKEWNNITYSGLDLSKKMVDHCRIKKPGIDFYSNDVLKDGWQIPDFDYIIMNGVFTEKLTLNHEEMFEYFKKLVKLVYDHANVGIALNVMSKQVDWERDDLFHLSLDELAWFVKEELSRKFIIRNDYGLYEYTIYILK
jgi:SAM-dependent methyltransferase